MIDIEKVDIRMVLTMDDVDKQQLMSRLKRAWEEFEGNNGGPLKELYEAFRRIS